MTPFLVDGDLPQDVQAALGDLRGVVVGGLNAAAARVAPCLADPTPEQAAEARLILVGAAKRWAEAGSGALSQQSAGPFQQTTDTRQRTGYSLWPSEVAALQRICPSARSRAFTIDPTPAGAYGLDVA